VDGWLRAWVDDGRGDRESFGSKGYDPQGGHNCGNSKLAKRRFSANWSPEEVSRPARHSMRRWCVAEVVSERRALSRSSGLNESTVWRASCDSALGGRARSENIDGAHARKSSARKARHSERWERSSILGRKLGVQSRDAVRAVSATSAREIGSLAVIQDVSSGLQQRGE